MNIEKYISKWKIHILLLKALSIKRWRMAGACKAKTLHMASACSLGKPNCWISSLNTSSLALCRAALLSKKCIQATAVLPSAETVEVKDFTSVSCECLKLINISVMIKI